MHSSTTTALISFFYFMSLSTNAIEILSAKIWKFANKTLDMNCDAGVISSTAALVCLSLGEDI